MKTILIVEDIELNIELLIVILNKADLILMDISFRHFLPLIHSHVEGLDLSPKHPTLFE